MGAVGTVTLRNVNGKTKMAVSIACSSPEHLQMFMKVGADTATSRTLDNLARHITG